MKPDIKELIERLEEHVANLSLLRSRLSARSRTEFFALGSIAPELLSRSEEALDEALDDFREAIALLRTKGEDNG